LYTSAYGGYFSNGKIVGYGAIRDNINKINQVGYFSNGVLSSAPIVSTYIEWTSPPESVMMVLGNFVNGKVDGIVYKYVSTGSIYCETGNNLSSVLARRRYILATKTQQSCTSGTVNSETALGTVTLMMNWVNNNLLNIFDMGTLSLAAGYDVDDTVRVNSPKLNTPNKNAFINSIYN
jgi:hypothetical protein